MPDFKILPWDTAFFGFPVARIEAGVRSAAGVADALDALRRRAVRLCYWMPEYGEENAGIARKLNGENVSAHACYALHNLSVAAAMPIAGVRIEQHEGERISPEILSLARSAGRFSRFAADRRMPAGTADRMFDIWIRRSIAREIADAVLVAYGASGAAVGLITVARERASGVIGLVAVDEGQQRLGIGRALLHSAATHLASLGVQRLRVTTQKENSAACALYEACGFALARLELTVHFWI